jgi:CBS domain-containing protein
VVTENEEILGIVTSDVILKYTYSADFNPAKTMVERITEENIMLARPTTSLDDVRTILTETGRNTIPVVDKELVGYITIRDLLTVKPEKTEAQVIP